MTAKQTALDLIQQLPDNAKLEDIIEGICFRCHVDEGLRQLDAGCSIDHEDVRRLFNERLG